MILFVDTSALVKLYIDEKGSEAMAARARESRLASSILAYAEIYATFARRRREDLLTEDEHSSSTDRFERDWQSVIVVPMRPEVARRVPDLVGRHPLRGADAVHLASALSLAEAGLEVTFAASDARLLAATAGEGLEMFDPESGS